MPQQFSKQKGGQRRTTLAKLKNTFRELAGGDEKALLEAFFESRFVRKNLSEEGRTIPRNDQIISKAQGKLQHIAKVVLELYLKETNYNKRQWASLLAPILKYKEMKDLGFPISQKTYARAREHARAFGPGTHARMAGITEENATPPSSPSPPGSPGLPAPQMPMPMAVMSSIPLPMPSMMNFHHTHPQHHHHHHLHGLPSIGGAIAAPVSTRLANMSDLDSINVSADVTHGNYKDNNELGGM